MRGHTSVLLTSLVVKRSSLTSQALGRLPRSLPNVKYTLVRHFNQRVRRSGSANSHPQGQFEGFVCILPCHDALSAVRAHPAAVDSGLVFPGFKNQRVARAVAVRAVHAQYPHRMRKHTRYRCNTNSSPPLTNPMAKHGHFRGQNSVVRCRLFLISHFAR